MREKRSSFTINLIETLNGFSIIQGDQLLNKASVSVEKQAQTAQTSSILNAMNSTACINSQFKDQKPLYQKINLVFPSNSNNFKSKKNHSETFDQVQKLQQINKLISRNEQAGKASEWFRLDEIHEIERNQIKLWYVQQHSQQTLLQIQQNKQFQKYLKIYKKHRNIIVTLYYKDYYSGQQYLSASQIRKRIPFDAYWLMKIHTFLSNNFIINCNTTNFNDGITGFNQYLFKINPTSGKLHLLDYEFEDQIHSTHKNSTQKDIQTLKFITQQIRPYCDYCGIHCGIVWFHHFKQIDPKQIVMIMKNVNSKNPPLSQRPYEMTLCTRCYCDGNFPLLLTHHDFKKTTVNDKLQPNKKKKLRKKRKDKKRKIKQRQRLDQKQQDEQIFEDNQDENGQKIIEENGQNQKVIEQEIIKSKQKISDHNFKQDGPQMVEENINSLIEKILSSLQKNKNFTLQETMKLLQLVQQHHQNWNLILEELNQQGMCTEYEVQDLIKYFLSLSKRNVSKLKEEYEPQQFLLQNYTSNRNNVNDTIAQRTLNKCIQLTNKTYNIPKPKDQSQWKNNLNELISLEQQKIKNRIAYLQKSQTFAVQMMRKLSKIKN